MFNWWKDTQDIDIEVSDVLGQIPTEDLELELEVRNQEKEEDPERFKHNEAMRHNILTISIDPESYDLVKRDDISISDFNDKEIKEYLQRQGYTVLRSNYGSDNDTVVRFLQDLTNYRYYETMCDVFGVPHTTSKEALVELFKANL